MRQLALICFLLFSVVSFSQDEIKIKDLELPNAPAFAILDYSSTNISAPNTVQALTLSLINATNSAKGFPTDYALEFSPYWVFKNKAANFSDYFDKERKEKYSKPYKNMSISFASVKKDTIQNLSIGIRTNIFTVNRKEKLKKIDTLEIQLKEFAQLLDDRLAPIGVAPPSGSDAYNEYMMNQMNKLEAEKSYATKRKGVYDKLDEIINMKPIFSIDAAAAYNHFFDQNEFKSGKFGKLGVWTTLNENFLFKNDKNYLCLYQYARFLVSEMNFDTVNNVYKKDQSFDLGTKIEFQFDKLSVGYEYIKRLSESDNYRSVGNIKYKLSDKLTLNGGFGKNFEKTDNLVSFLGVSWGISANNEIKTDGK